MGATWIFFLMKLWVIKGKTMKSLVIIYNGFYNLMGKIWWGKGCGLLFLIIAWTECIWNVLRGLMFAESVLWQCSARTCLFRDFPQAFLVLHGNVSLFCRNLTGPKNFHTIFNWVSWSSWVFWKLWIELSLYVIHVMRFSIVLVAFSFID